MSLWKDKFIKINSYSRSGQKIKQVRKIVIHWTANFGGTAQNHFNYFNNLTGRYASAHLFVDKIEALCIVPLNELCYHANDGSVKKIPELKPNANQYSIGIEMCVEKDGTIHPNTVKQTEDIAVELCKRYGLNPLTDIVRHFDITGKNCPAPWVKDGSLFTKFKNSVNAKYNNKTVTPANPTPAVDSSPSVPASGVIEVLVDSLNLRSDASFNAPIIRTLPKGSKWKVYSIKNGMYNLGGNQWCSAGASYVKFTPNTPASNPTTTPTPAPTPAPTSAPPKEEKKVDNGVEVKGVIEVLVDKLNLRNDADFNAPIIRTLHKGSKWKAYRLKNGMYNLGGNQWCSAGNSYVKFIPDSTKKVMITVDSLNIRKSSSLTSTIVGVALKGQTFPIYETKNNMYRIGDNKWISASNSYSKLV